MSESASYPLGNVQCRPWRRSGNRQRNHFWFMTIDLANIPDSISSTSLKSWDIKPSLFDYKLPRCPVQSCSTGESIMLPSRWTWVLWALIQPFTLRVMCQLISWSKKISTQAPELCWPLEIQPRRNWDAVIPQMQVISNLVISNVTTWILHMSPLVCCLHPVIQDSSSII